MRVITEVTENKVMNKNTRRNINFKKEIDIFLTILKDIGNSCLGEISGSQGGNHKCANGGYPLI